MVTSTSTCTLLLCNSSRYCPITLFCSHWVNLWLVHSKCQAGGEWHSASEHWWPSFISKPYAAHKTVMCNNSHVHVQCTCSHVHCTCLWNENSHPNPSLPPPSPPPLPPFPPPLLLFLPSPLLPLLPLFSSPLPLLPSPIPPPSLPPSPPLPPSLSSYRDVGLVKEAETLLCDVTSLYSVGQWPQLSSSAYSILAHCQRKLREEDK